MPIIRLFVEKKPEHRSANARIKSDIQNVLGLAVEDARIILRYDIEGISGEELEKAKRTIFSEPPVDEITESDEFCPGEGYKLFGVEYLPGQYDQRADSAAQCVQLLTMKARPAIRCAVLYALKGVQPQDLIKIKAYLINPVEARECSLQKPETLAVSVAPPSPVKLLNGFTEFTDAQIKAYHKEMGFAMSVEDLLFVQAHFKTEMRNPTETELKVIDTYWSDHCRHTTFLTRLKKVDINSGIPAIKKAFETYLALFNKHYGGRADKYPSLMDIATMGARELKQRGKIPNLDISEEINACSIRVTADVNGGKEEWLVMFKNETHNHPTEIEPFGGAATCLGGAIRDPLSGRVYVYQAMRVTGAADINAPLKSTLKGKLPQRVISKTATAGFSSYGNQIGLATGIVQEYYHPGYVAKRLETGFVVGAAPAKNVIRKVPEKGDVVILIGGETGRDGCGGATGSSKAHTADSVTECGAEVQKGNPLTERKIQRLFRNPDLTKLIKRCNDFGAGGVSVAVGELSDGLDINLDNLPKKYQGLNATELAISESQERMAVVVTEKDAYKIMEFAAQENLDACVIAKVTDTGCMRMYYGGNLIVDLKRAFLNTNGVAQVSSALITEKPVKFFDAPDKNVSAALKKSGASALKNSLCLDNAASQKGLGEIFDSTVGAGTVFMPFGGKNQLTPAINMAAKLPVLKGETDTCTVCANGFDPYLSSESPFTGAVYAVLTSVIKVVIAGVPLSSVRLTFQEYFERLKDVPERWGKPASALLGALYAQLGLELASIGGKDSMSGTFEKIDVPPTLISFALGVGKASGLITNVLSRPGQKVYRYRIPKDAAHIPDFEPVKEFLSLLQGEIGRGLVDFATVTETGGAATAIAKSCFGNGFGFKFAHKNPDLFAPSWGDILFSTDKPDDYIGYTLDYIGETTDDKNFTFGADDSVPYADAVASFTGKFSGIYPVTAPAAGFCESVDYAAKKIIVAKKKIAASKVLIPVFPGTNCEYDTARRFIAAGAEVETAVIRNRNEKEIDESVRAMAERVKEAQILAFPGGFSGGDEPDGSGKFIATFFRNKRLESAVTELLNKREGLVIGICNGFQALVKLGLLPGGKICELESVSPTLTFNNISRHVSNVSYIRVASNLSPWLKNCKAGEVYAVAISHGEGKFVASKQDIENLRISGQIATQYCDLSGKATMVSPFNPNGSYMAIEGVTSPDGRVLGKMGHSERIGANIMKNIDMPTDMRIFEAGVEYFK